MASVSSSPMSEQILEIDLSKRVKIEREEFVKIWKKLEDILRQNRDDFFSILKLSEAIGYKKLKLQSDIKDKYTKEDIEETKKVVQIVKENLGFKQIVPPRDLENELSPVPFF